MLLRNKKGKSQQRLSELQRIIMYVLYVLWQYGGWSAEEEEITEAFREVGLFSTRANGSIFLYRHRLAHMLNELYLSKSKIDFEKKDWSIYEDVDAINDELHSTLPSPISRTFSAVLSKSIKNLCSKELVKVLIGVENKKGIVRGTEGKEYLRLTPEGRAIMADWVESLEAKQSKQDSARGS